MEAKFQGKENTNKPSTVIGTLLERLLNQKNRQENPLLESSTILLSPDDVKIPGARYIPSMLIYVERHRNCLQALLVACQAIILFNALKHI